jgi:AraC-like DNA-binding protein
MVHIGPSLVEGVLADLAGGRSGLPLFAEPVMDDPVIARRLRRLHAALAGPAEPLRRDELLAAAVSALVLRGGHSAGVSARRASAARPGSGARSDFGGRSVFGARSDFGSASARDIAGRARALLLDRYAEPLTADDLATAMDASRYAVYRAFTARYGLSPSDYQRQLRLRAAREQLRAGRPAAQVAADVGFADQAHLTRWFVRYFGLTPAAYRHSDPAVRRPSPR